MAQQQQGGLSAGVATGTVTTFYTSPASTRTFIRALTATNPSTAPIVLVVTILLDPLLDGGLIRTAIPGLALAPLQTYLCPELVNHTLNAGGLVQIGGLGINFFFSGVHIVG